MSRSLPTSSLTGRPSVMLNAVKYLAPLFVLDFQIDPALHPGIRWRLEPPRPRTAAMTFS
ncbi:MAG: hypothetical protein FJY67_11940 [Calditrichaeota bacterium]|nr:hypothetical protein [Calditrichota bacterium]